MKMKRQVALLVISAFLIGLLPMRNGAVSKAGQGSTSAGADYGLNNPTTNRNGDTTWDCVWFGSYWQEDTNGDGKADKNDAKQPIKWRVLSVNGDDAFLLADKNLDCQKYNDTYTDVTWETCTMRSWLNGYGATSNKEGKDYSSNNFIMNAFLAGEQSAIRTTNVVNNDSSYSGVEGGNDTSDKVYLLSLDEVMNPVYGFSIDYSLYDEDGRDKSRSAKNTEYAKGQGAWTSTSTEHAGNGIWCLRSPGDVSEAVSDVHYTGHMNRYGSDVNSYFYTARPALHLNLSFSSSWSYAGTVISKGEIGSAKVGSIKLKQKKRTVTVSWKWVAAADEYQIWYSTSKKWKGKKQKLVSENKVTVKNLKQKKTYYFRVRALRRGDGGGKVYGAWSKTKKITMKK